MQIRRCSNSACFCMCHVNDTSNGRGQIQIITLRKQRNLKLIIRRLLKRTQETAFWLNASEHNHERQKFGYLSVNTFQMDCIPPSTTTHHPKTLKHTNCTVCDWRMWISCYNRAGAGPGAEAGTPRITHHASRKTETSCCQWARVPWTYFLPTMLNC